MARLVRPLLAAALAAAVLSPSAPAGAAGEVEVSLVAGQFAPAVVQVPAGSNLSFVNKDATNYPVFVGNHNVIPDSNVGGMTPGTKPFPTSSDLITPGSKWTCTGGSSGLTCTGIDAKPTVIPPGTYAVACGLHPNQMHALIKVD
jgi:plastocyanin